MAIDRVREYLKKYDLEKEIMEFSSSSATVSDAACAIGCLESDIAKSLSFFDGDKPILIVVAGDKRIDNGKYKSTFSCKAKMIPYEEVESVIGHAAGGVCPFGVNEQVEVYLDVSLKSHDFIYPACGSSNSAIKLTIQKLEEVSNYIKWVDVCK